MARLCKAVNKGSLAGSPSPGLCPLAWWVSPGPGGREVSLGPGEGGLARGSPLAKQASGQSKKRDGQKVARASYSTLGVSRPRVPIPGVPIPGYPLLGNPPENPYSNTLFLPTSRSALMGQSWPLALFLYGKILQYFIFILWLNC